MKSLKFHTFIVSIATLVVASTTATAAPHSKEVVLVVSSFGTNNVLHFNGTTGELIDVFASGGGLDGSEGIVFGPDDNLYVSSEENDSVLRFDGRTGVFMDVFASGGGLDQPEGVVFGPDDNLYVVSQLGGNVLRYNGQTGAFIDVFASGGGLSVPALGVSFVGGKEKHTHKD